MEVSFLHVSMERVEADAPTQMTILKNEMFDLNLHVDSQRQLAPFAEDFISILSCVKTLSMLLWQFGAHVVALCPCQALNC